MSTPGYIRLIGFIKRRPDLTEKQFSEHWRNVHGPLVAPWAIKHGVTGYTQIHTPAHIRQKFQEASPLAISTLAYDGAADWKFESFEKYLAAFADPYYLNVIEPDEHNFLDKTLREVATLTMGAHFPIVEDGRAVVDTSKEVAVWKDWEEKASAGQ